MQNIVSMQFTREKIFSTWSVARDPGAVIGKIGCFWEVTALGLKEASIV